MHEEGFGVIQLYFVYHNMYSEQRTSCTDSASCRPVVVVVTSVTTTHPSSAVDLGFIRAQYNAAALFIQDLFYQ